MNVVSIGARPKSLIPILLAGLACLLITFYPASPAQAQQRVVIRGGDEPALDAAAKAGIIDVLTEALNEEYVFPEKAREMETLVRKKLEGGEYESFSGLMAFTMQLTEDFRSVCHDRHLRVMPAPPPAPDDENAPTPEEERRERLESLRHQNFGFRTIELLPGNIGYLDLRMFADASLAGDTAVAAMNFLAHSDAVIFDLRRNGGGSPSMIQLITSYFYEEPIHLNSFYIRKTDKMRQFWTQAQVRGPRMCDVPIYVLTSGYTFSGAEEFTYNLKNLERATIIGETTGGGAHPVSFKAFPEQGVGISLPYGRAVNPITGTNWEGTGIEPHIEVPESEALEVAHMEAMKKLLEKEIREDRKQQLLWHLKTLEVKQAPVAMKERELKAYVGVYGPRTIRLKQGSLYYQREDRPEYKLIPMGDEMFMLEGLDYFRLRFEKNPSGAVTRLVGLYDNGRRDANERTGT